VVFVSSCTFFPKSRLRCWLLYFLERKFSSGNGRFLPWFYFFPPFLKLSPPFLTPPCYSAGLVLLALLRLRSDLSRFPRRAVQRLRGSRSYVAPYLLSFIPRSCPHPFFHMFTPLMQRSAHSTTPLIRAFKWKIALLFSVPFLEVQFLPLLLSTIRARIPSNFVLV